MSGSTFGTIGAAVAVTAVLLACSDPPPNLPPPRLEVRNAALVEVRARLAELPGADVAKAAALTHHADHRVRRAAALRLMAMGPAAAPALADLAALLRDEEPRVRTAAARALGETGSLDAVDPLADGLVDGDRQVRLWCWKAIRRLGDQAIPAVADLLVTGSRTRKLSYLDEADRKRTGPEELMDRLASIGVPAVEPITAKLSVEDAQLRIALLKVLGLMGADARAALPDVIALVEAEPVDADMRIRALQAIEKIGDLHPDVMRAVKRAVESKDKKISDQGKRTLAALQKAAKNKPKPPKRGSPPDPKQRRQRPPQPQPPELGLAPMNDFAT